MSSIVPRTCTEVLPYDAEPARHAVSRPLADFRAARAYVLLGDPGSGKSTSFEAERDALGEEASPVISARNFLTFDHDAEWRGKTLFIDGLDEVRAGSIDARTPFDAIRRKLDSLGKPCFRLSCREADWLGASDRANLDRVSPDSRVEVLRLDPLTDEDAAEILRFHPHVNDAQAFMATASEKGVDGFLRNPQSLDLLARVVGGAGSWPTSRLELFEEACRQMVRERNPEHLAAARSAVGARVASAERLLDAAGHLCAVQRLSSNRYGWIEVDGGDSG